MVQNDNQKDNLEEKKSKYQKLEEKLGYKSKNVWNEIDDDTKRDIFSYAEQYKKFLGTSKSERLTVKWVLEQAQKRGFKSLDDARNVQAGDLLYTVNRNKNIALIRVGRSLVENGLNFIVAHGDTPRLDLKQIPLHEDTEIALLKTHYYGGIKKYQWLNIPLALSGVVITKGNKKVEIEIGFKDDDPVFVIPDLLPHLSRKVQNEKKANEFIEGETLNLLFGNIPVKDDKIKEKVKIAVLERLFDEYGIVEEDFVSAELQAIPAVNPSDVGIDRALIGGYGHDDRVSTYGAVTAIFDVKTIDKTAVALIVDKEEIGSDGPTGAKSLFIFNVVGRWRNQPAFQQMSMQELTRCTNLYMTKRMRHGFPTESY